MTNESGLVRDMPVATAGARPWAAETTSKFQYRSANTEQPTGAMPMVLSLIPNSEKYRKDTLTLDALTVWTPGRKIPGIDTDGDGIPDFVDGDDDNDGTFDFVGKGDRPLVFRREGYVQGGGRWEGRFTVGRRQFVPGDTLDPIFASVKPFSRERVTHLVDIMTRYIDEVILRV